MTAEGFFELGKTVPGVFAIFGGSNAPKIEDFCTTFLGIKNHLDKDDDAGVNFAMFVTSGGVGIKTSGFVVVD